MIAALLKWLKRPSVVVVLVVVGSFAAVIADDVRALAEAEPPPGVSTLAEVLEWQPGPHSAWIHTADAVEHLVMLGPRRGLTASGPSAYVFDRTGRLIDWTADAGDAPAFQARWWGGERTVVELDEKFATDWRQGN